MFTYPIYKSTLRAWSESRNLGIPFTDLKDAVKAHVDAVAPKNVDAVAPKSAAPEARNEAKNLAWDQVSRFIGTGECEIHALGTAAEKFMSAVSNLPKPTDELRAVSEAARNSE
jgi:hypothetical protein